MVAGNWQDSILDWKAALLSVARKLSLDLAAPDDFLSVYACIVNQLEGQRARFLSVVEQLREAQRAEDERKEFVATAVNYLMRTGLDYSAGVQLDPVQRFLVAAADLAILIFGIDGETFSLSEKGAIFAGVVGGRPGRATEAGHQAGEAGPLPEQQPAAP